MSTVDDAKKALGLRLRDIRKDARLSGRDLAVLTGWHFTKVSKIEHGRTMPAEADLEAWCFHCTAQAELPDLIASAREIEKAYAELRRLHRSGTARFQRELAESATKGRRFRAFTVNLVPGAYQTAAYAATVLADAAEMLGHPADVEPTVDSRMKRAEIFRSGERLYHAVVLENVLNAGLVPPNVMVAQLRHMLELQRAPTLRLGIIPTGKRRYMPMCEFDIVDDREVRVETFSALIRVTQPREIAVYAKIFDHYARQAVYGQATTEIIKRTLDELEQ